MDGIAVEGRVRNEREEPPMAERREITPGYFDVLGIPLLKGRTLNDQDANPRQPLTAVINEAMAKRFWPDEDPIGKRFRSGPNSDQNPWITVVGVVGNVRHLGLDIEPRPELYRHFQTSPPNSPIFVVRSKTEPGKLFATVRSLIKQIDGEIAVSGMTTMKEQVSISVATRRFALTLFGLFAVVALLLAAVGLYAVMSYFVAQRTHEIGIRAALGAQSGDLLRLIVRQGMTLVAIGIVAGLAAAFALTRLMQSLLFEINATDPATFALVVVALAAVAVLACWLPARRATKVDPMIALRCE
jgi:putative ABC transport system permease protein